RVESERDRQTSHRRRRVHTPSRPRRGGSHSRHGQGESRGLSRRRRITRRSGLHRHAAHANRRRAQRAHRTGRGREQRERQHRTGGWPAWHHAARPIQGPHAAKARLKNTLNGARRAYFRRAPILFQGQIRLCNGSKAFSSAAREIFRTNVSFTKSGSSRCSRGWGWRGWFVVVVLRTGGTFKALGACSAIIEAEANYGAGQLLFLGERFITEAKSYPIAFDALKKLKGVYDNTMTTTMWRFVELAWPELPMVGIVSCHPLRARRPADFNPEDPCRHFIQSPAFAQRFSQLSEKEVFEKVAEYCGGQRGGPLG